MKYRKAIEQIEIVISLLQKELDEGRRNGGANKTLLRHYEEALQAINNRDYLNVKLTGSCRMYWDWAVEQPDEAIMEAMSKAETLFAERK
ncbi:hypothetical protein [Butyrivibrio sp. MC2021]|uniref:hypothetical protein n=1 Tax=Butyrivibrio sp. MC2021 TaxID=1408306 RepID=UPI00047CF940|nr:hypothetical protein [Butyrivibrio sp. MC2021]